MTRNFALRSRPLAALLVGMLACHADGDPGTIAWLGENLVPDAGFESVGDDLSAGGVWSADFPPGKSVSVGADTQVYLSGEKSLRIHVPESGAGAATRSAFIPVAGGNVYLVSLAFRQEGFSTRTDGGERHEGVGAHARVEWYDGDRRLLGRSDGPSRFPYGPSPWDLRDAFVPAPASAKFARVTASVSNSSAKHLGKSLPSTLWIDAWQLRLYRPPATPAWAEGETVRVVDGVVDQSRVRSYFVASSGAFRNNRGGQWSKVVVDAAAERGSALHAPPGTGHGIMAHSPYFDPLPPGLYRLRVRAEVSDTTDGERLGFVDVATQLSGQRAFLSIDPAQFTRAGEYEVVTQDFVLRDSGWWCVRVYTEGTRAWSIDSIKIFPLEEFPDRRLLSLYPGSEGEVSPSLQPRSAGPCRALFVAGLGYDFFRPASAMRLLDLRVTIDPAWVQRGRSARVKGFPADVAALFDYNIVYLCNLPIRSLSMLQKNALREYVHRGGALVVLGGHQGYERGGWRGSLLEEALPVSVAATVEDGLAAWPHGQTVTLADNTDWLAGLDVRADPRVYFLHRVEPKRSAAVVARAGELPFAVTGAFGEGRVACVLGLPQGAPADGDTGFWEWPDWVYFLRDLSWWTMRWAP